MTEFTLEFDFIKVVDNSTFSSVRNKTLITKIKIDNNKIHRIDSDIFFRIYQIIT